MVFTSLALSIFRKCFEFWLFAETEYFLYIYKHLYYNCFFFFIFFLFQFLFFLLFYSLTGKRSIFSDYFCVYWEQGKCFRKIIIVSGLNLVLKPRRGESVYVYLETIARPKDRKTFSAFIEMNWKYEKDMCNFIILQWIIDMFPLIHKYYVANINRKCVIIKLEKVKQIVFVTFSNLMIIINQRKYRNILAKIDRCVRS